MKKRLEIHNRLISRNINNIICSVNRLAYKNHNSIWDLPKVTVKAYSVAHDLDCHYFKYRLHVLASMVYRRTTIAMKMNPINL